MVLDIMTTFQTAQGESTLIKNNPVYREFHAEREEIFKHKWIQSQKEGYDIGFESALIDWIVKHRTPWRKSIHQNPVPGLLIPPALHYKSIQIDLFDNPASSAPLQPCQYNYHQQPVLQDVIGKHEIQPSGALHHTSELRNHALNGRVYLSEYHCTRTFSPHVYIGTNLELAIKLNSIQVPFITEVRGSV